MPILLSELTQRVPRQVEARVKKARDEARSVIQEALRSECRLNLRSADETEENRPGAQVPVEIAPGYPAVLEGVSFPDGFEQILLVARYRSALEQTKTGTIGLLELRRGLAAASNPDKWIHSSEAELKSVRDWSSALLKHLETHDPVKRVLAVDEDILGVYRYELTPRAEDESVPNKASIQLYWAVIGLIAEWMGFAIEDLTVVVLTHELAHSYTQLGADIDGRRWLAADFAAAEPGLKEGLAQYYTERVLARAEKRFPGALKAFRKMLTHQPKIYSGHSEWINHYSPEAVRVAMLEVRRRKLGKGAQFIDRLNEAQKHLVPENRSLVSWS